MEELDRAKSHLAASAEEVPADSLVYFYNEGLLASAKSQCLLHLNEPQRAADAAREALTLADTSFVRNFAFGKLFLGNAHIKSGELDEAVKAMSDVVDLAMQNRSARLVKELRTARTKIQPWQDVLAVRELDERLMAYGLLLSGNT